MSTYIIRGHGGTPEGRMFILGNNQYVIFPTKCGNPASMSTTLKNSVRKLIANKNMVYRFMRGNINKTRFPREIRNMRILGPKMSVSNSIISMKNTTRFPSNPQRSAGHRWYHSTAGVWKIKNREGALNYLHGRGNTKFISQIIGNRPGVYYIDACRVTPGMTQNRANKILKNIKAGKNVNVPNVKYMKNIENFEKRLKLKRKREEPNIKVRKNNNKNNRPKKMIRTNNRMNIN